MKVRGLAAYQKDGWRNIAITLKMVRLGDFECNGLVSTVIARSSDTRQLQWSLCQTFYRMRTRDSLSP